MSDNKPFKLNLGALKNTSIEENKTSIDLSDNKKTENKENLISFKKNELEESKSNIIDTKIKSTIEKAHSLDLSKMRNKKKDKINEQKEALKKIKNEETIEEKEVVEENEVFSNYESDFNKNKETILQKVEKFKNFVKPKTRLGFLLRITGITAFGIASLFVLMPEKHNLDNYKANLIIAKQKIECKIDTTKCIKKEITKTIKKEITQIDSRTLKKEIFVIEYKTKIIDGKEVIIYMGKTYNSQEEFNIKIKEIIKRKKLQKLQEFLLKNKEGKM